MSRFGDILVELGPVAQDYAVTPGLSSDVRWVRAADVNALRDELIELRRVAAICMCGCGPDEHLQVNSTACCSCDCPAYTARGEQPSTATAPNPRAVDS